MSEGKLNNCHYKEEHSFDVNISAIFLTLLFPFSTHATCTPTPDCASIGYTETSCEGKFVRCPFDTSKLFCAPCDSKFQYSCSDNNITGGIGSACNNKYVSCSCSTTEYTFSNGECICNNFTPADCTVGSIYYPNGKCSNEYISCQNPVGIIVKDNELVMSKPIQMPWSGDYTDITALPNLSGPTGDYAGKENTLAIVNHYGTNADTTKIAGVFCYNYAPQGLENTKGQWYLPAGGELYTYLFGNYNMIKNTATLMQWNYIYGHYFWSSSEYDNQYAWFIICNTGSPGITDPKAWAFSTSCFLDIS